MKTRTLWRSLQQPSEQHPVYARILSRDKTRLPDIPLPSFLLVLANLFRGIARFARQEIIAPLAQVIAIGLAPLLLPLMSTLYGLTLSFNIAFSIGRAQQQHTYDLMGVTPAGTWGVSRAICTAYLTRFNVFERINTLRTYAITIMLLFGLSVVGLATTPFGISLSPITIVITLLILVNLDSMQSVVLGCLSGMIAQTYRQNDFTPATRASGIFLTVHFGSYILIFGAFAIALNIYGRSGLQSLLGDVLIEGVFVLLFLGVRETAIWVMWRQLEAELTY